MQSEAIEVLVRRAQGALAEGRLGIAAQLFRQVLQQQPQHPQALFFLGDIHFRENKLGEAQRLFSQAMVAAPNNPVIALHLSFVARRAGDTTAEMNAVMHALSLDAYFFPAVLARGDLLERMGQPRQAVMVYKDLLKILPPPDRLPKEFEAPVSHARDLVRSDAEERDRFLQTRLGALKSKYAGSPLDRFEQCKDVMLGVKQVYTPQPTLLHFPGLPAEQYYDNAAFPKLASLETQTDIIRSELVALLEAEGAEFRPYVTHPKGVPLNQWAELNHSPRWSALFLWRDGKPVEENCARCPKTAELLRMADMADIPGYAPTAFFSVLEPHTHIPAHTGVTNTRLIVHLPLIVPEQCRFRVGNETRDWEYGRAWVFDDTIEHEAWNDSDKPRVILIFDVWNPYLSQAERELTSELLIATRDFDAGR